MTLDVMDQLRAQQIASSPPPALRDTTVKEGVDYVTATYAGNYYEGVGQGGNKSKPFRYTVRVPMSLVRNDIHSPVSIFVHYFAMLTLHKDTGNHRTQHCSLVECSGVPLNALEGDHMLNWVTDIDQMLAIANSTKPEYQPYDVRDPGPGVVPYKRQKAHIITELYPTVHQLRQAVKDCKNDPEGFMKQQEKRSLVMLGEKKRVDQELKALGY